MSNINTLFSPPVQVIPLFSTTFSTGLVGLVGPDGNNRLNLVGADVAGEAIPSVGVVVGFEVGCCVGCRVGSGVGDRLGGGFSK